MCDHGGNNVMAKRLFFLVRYFLLLNSNLNVARIAYVTKCVYFFRIEMFSDKN